MFERQQRKKYGWSDSADMTQENAEVNDNSFIVYEKEGQFVKEFPNGKIVPLKLKGNTQ
jgi:hypothetical protein